MLIISNFVLGISNIWDKLMKKTYLPIIVSGLVLITTALWFVNSKTSFRITDLIQLLLILVVISFAVVVAVRRLKSATRKQPVEDELSKKIMQKAASLSYFISIYIWLGVLYLYNNKKIEADLLIGWGILAMAVTFAICWFVISKMGIKDV
jgi:peptidoglycan/LPS O-acetylase OafA/YrhL